MDADAVCVSYRQDEIWGPMTDSKCLAYLDCCSIVLIEQSEWMSIMST
jgi:hypothetical protein